MEGLDKAHKHCFKEAKKYVRDELKIDKFAITNHKIVRYCWEYDNNIDKVKKQLKDHADHVQDIDLKKIQVYPKKFAQPCTYISNFSLTLEISRFSAKLFLLILSF